jgi:hypothetical protein
MAATNSFDAGHRLTQSLWWVENDLNPSESYAYQIRNLVYDGANLVRINNYSEDYRQEFFRYDYTHDAQGRIDCITISESDDSLYWEASEKAEITYDASDTGTMADFIENLSRKEAANVYYYSANDRYIAYYGKPSQILFYYMDYPEREWALYGRELHFYDTNGDLDFIAYDEYDSGIWEPYELYEYSYDAHHNLLMVVYWGDDYYRTMVPYERYRFEWEAFTANDDQIASPPAFSAYPNPFAGDLTIDLKSGSPAQVTVYNLRGQKVWSQSLSGQDKLHWQASGLPNGMYIVSIRQNAATFTRKVMLLR